MKRNDGKSTPFMPLISGVVLFGSQARNEADQYSDRDICAFAKAVNFDQRRTLRDELAFEYQTTPESVCLVTETVAHEMATTGSLFLWHLKLESKVLQDANGFVEGLFGALHPYSGYKRDLDLYERIRQDVTATTTDINEADGHALFAACRNTCMLLTMWHGTPSFGRDAAYARAQAHFPDLPLLPSSYRILRDLHLVYTRGVALTVASLSDSQVRTILTEIQDLIQFCRTKIGT
ncbi:MAG TPA: nucleotidyltransferase domain-containing protein [Polyangiaceae bacterium]